MRKHRTVVVAKKRAMGVGSQLDRALDHRARASAINSGAGGYPADVPKRFCPSKSKMSFLGPPSYRADAHHSEIRKRSARRSWNARAYRRRRSPARHAGSEGAGATRLASRQSQQQMTEDFIDVYGNYAIKLLRLQNDMIQTFERYRRGNKQTVEVRHVHIHSGGQGVVGIINPTDDRDAGVRE